MPKHSQNVHARLHRNYTRLISRPPWTVTRAYGLLIIPELVKGGFIVGAEAGFGVFMVRGSDGTWSAPAFYTLAAGSIGLQIGGQVGMQRLDLSLRVLLDDLA